jgi:hypothetical protein
MDDTRMPALYLGHGAPPLLDDELWTGQLSAWARELPRPTAILIVSAHWESAPLSLSGSAAGTPLVYDFGGFAPRYYQMTYPTPDAGALARRVAAAMPDTEPVHEHTGRGLDHGAWVPLKVMYPAAEIPVLQLSMPTMDPGRLLALGRRLRPLRDEGVLVIGSGFLTHGLPFLRDFRPAAGLVARLRPVGGRGPGPRRRRGAGQLRHQGTRDAVRAPDRRALRAAVRHPRSGHGPGGAAEHRHRRLLPGAGQALGPGRLKHRPSGRQAMARAAAERAQPQDRPTPVPPWP